MYLQGLKPTNAVQEFFTCLLIYLFICNNSANIKHLLGFRHCLKGFTELFCLILSAVGEET